MKFTPLYAALLLASANLSAATMTISTTTNSRDYPLSQEQPLTLPLTKDTYTVRLSDVGGDCSTSQETQLKFNKPVGVNCRETTELKLKVRLSGDYQFVLDEKQHTLTLTRQKKKGPKKEFKRPLPKVECETFPEGEVRINLADTFADGTQVRDRLTGSIHTVNQGQIRLKPSRSGGGMVLIEAVEKAEPADKLNWRNANIYFVMVDRFYNGETDNDNSYGRRGDGKDEIGTFHGGDIKGVIEKLDYIQSLGTDAIWLSPIVEQIHGFVGGGESGSFPFYAYHGYWTRDFTKIDENFGQEEDLKRLVEEAHKRGIKVLLDAVINHAGYATMADLQLDGVDVVSPEPNWPQQWSNWQPKASQNWHSFHSNIDYNHGNWLHWWGKDWIRATFPQHKKPGSGDKTMSLAGLPDFITESDKYVTPPEWLLENPGTRVEAKDKYTVADYLIEWQTDWVKRFGIDGFRVDTVKHVEGDVWKRLKDQASRSLVEWREKNNKTGQAFWMMGEVWGHSAYRSPYFDDGFDALINFDLQKKMDKGAACFSQMADTYQAYADTIRKEPDFNPVSYISSHDTELFFSRFKSYEMQRDAATALLLSPGAIQVYYGDEIGRNIGPYADDFHQGTRSDMLWKLDDNRQALLTHWQALGQFRQAHPAVGAGEHKEIPQQQGYGFSRTLKGDKVVVAFVGK